MRRLSASLRSRFLYIASIRAVTAKPPKMFTLASATATRPSHFELGLPAAAAAISAPTTITEEMALVTLISGVCSAGVTDQTTIIADEAGQHENRQDRDEVHDPSAKLAQHLWRVAAAAVECRSGPAGSLIHDAVSDFLTFSRACVAR